MNPSATAQGQWTPSRRRTDIALAALILAAVVMVLLPMPTMLVDLLLSLQLAGAIVLALSTIGAHAISLALFPTLLLITTLFRLALNVSTTRLILANADAGQVVHSFGTFAVHDSLVVGVVMLIVIALVHLLVVARGSERVAEVAARFSLDAMPGRQMAIDADVRAGFIDARAARIERAALRRESRLYGAMDGAMRFVKGDAIVAIAIVAINLIGGLIVGLGIRDMNASDALLTYTRLAIGDGLAAQLPALLIAIAAGLSVAQAAGRRDGRAHIHAREDVPTDAHEHQPAIRAHRNVFVVAGLFAMFACVPGLPGGPFAGTAVITASVAAWLWWRHSHDSTVRSSAAAPTRATEYLHAAPHTDHRPASICIEMDAPLARVLDADQPDGQFARECITSLQAHLDRWLCIAVPPITVRVLPGNNSADSPASSNRANPGYHYLLRIHGARVDSATFAPPGVASAPGNLPGNPLTSIELTRAIHHRLFHSLERYAFELVDVQSVDVALDQLARSQPALVRAAVPALVTRPSLALVIRELVREHLGIGDLSTVLLALLRHPPAPGAPALPLPTRIDMTRRALSRHITDRFAADGQLSVWRLTPLLEDTLRDATTHDRAGAYLALEPDIADDIVRVIGLEIGQAIGDDIPAERAVDGLAVLLVSMDIRRFVAELLETDIPRLVVLCPQELTPETSVQTISVIDIPTSDALTTDEFAAESLARGDMGG